METRVRTTIVTAMAADRTRTRRLPLRLLMATMAHITIMATAVEAQAEQAITGIVEIVAIMATITMDRRAVSSRTSYPTRFCAPEAARWSGNFQSTPRDCA